MAKAAKKPVERVLNPAFAVVTAGAYPTAPAPPDATVRPSTTTASPSSSADRNPFHPSNHQQSIPLTQRAATALPSDKPHFQAQC